MATTTRRTRKSPSTTTRKSSETPTETPESDSQASEKASDETSTLEKSSSSPSSDDETEALFAEADADAAQKGQEDAQEPTSAKGGKKPAKAAPEVPEGDVVTFEVDLPNLSNYTFKGVVSGNTITVVEDAKRTFRLPGSKKTGEVLAHHKGQLLPLSQFESFIKE